VKYASALACALALGACARTEILLTVSESGLVIGTDIDNLQIEVQPASDPPTAGNWYFSKSIDLCANPGQPDCQPQAFVDSDYTHALTFPIALLIMPGDPSFSADIRVWVNGYEAGKQVMAAGDRFPFAKGKRLYVDIPLYSQCLGDLSCQALDQACASDLNCVSIPTTTTPNPADMAGSPPPDATMLGDLSVACGQIGLNCCNGSSCGSGLTCGAVSKICYSSSVTCGQVGQICCTGDQEPCAAAGAMCAPNGTCGQSCTATSCGNGQVCSTDGVCIVCGGEGDACCNGNTCTDPAADSCNGMTCAPCGGLNETCCAGSTCSSPTLYACGASNTCVLCGGSAPNQPCCGGSAQTCLNTPDGGTQATCEGNVCVQCGHEMGICCPGGPGQQQDGRPLGPVINVPLSGGAPAPGMMMCLSGT
jgi:hypothetical protein